MAGMLGVVGGAEAQPAVAPAGPPQPIVREVPPGMEAWAARKAEAERPRADAEWRRGFTLRLGIGVGTLVEAEEEMAQTTSTTIALALGGFVTDRVAAYLVLEGTSAGSEEMRADGVGFAGLGADLFLTDRIVLGAGIGQASTSLRRGGLFDDHEELQGFGAQARAAYVFTQRRKQAFELGGALTTGVFEEGLQLTTVNLQVAYRFL